jgi:hypothetical protein
VRVTPLSTSICGRSWTDGPNDWASEQISTCTFETYPASPVPVTMTPVAFPKSIFNELAAELPRRACRTGESITMESKETARIGFRSVVTGLAFLVMVTLLGLGSAAASTTHYIAANGSDSSNGTSKTTPWLHAPGMPNCSGGCASYTPAPGDNFIFRGGDTWHFGNSSASPYTGGELTWSWSGSSGSPIYLGVDEAWYSGSTWARPIFTGDNPLTPNPGVFGDSVSTCPYQSGTNNIIISFLNQSYVTFDDVEFVGMCNDTSTPPVVHDWTIDDRVTANMLYERLYFHGWTHASFSTCSNSGGSGICDTQVAFHGQAANTYGVGDQYVQIVIDGSDSDPGGYGQFWGGCSYDIHQSVLRYSGNIVTHNFHLFHDNLLEYLYDPSDGQSHGNVFESVNETTGTNAFYNNLIRHVSPNGINQVGFWPAPPVGTTDYFFNNVRYDDQTGNDYFLIGENGGQNIGTAVVFNNTFEQVSNSSPVLNCIGTGTRTLIAANNHYIADIRSPYGSGCSTQSTFTTELAMSHATATTDGYTTSQTYANSPTLISSPTVGAGTNKNAAYCGALTTAGLSDAATACQSDTTYSCTYNSSDHTVSCPTRAANSRPGGAWDIGGYEYNAQGTPPNPPTALTAVVN